MIGEYEETVGTCYLFSESGKYHQDAPAFSLLFDKSVLHGLADKESEPKPSAEMLPSGENKDKSASSSNEAPSKEVKHLASVEKVLKFRPVNADQQQRRAYQHKDREI
ncbi:hypothetical protein EJB05_18780 [Eragrostis curvula]|uniref:Transcription factor TFIIIC triple barrel domain-containing protein n=1 Tax=Eragrostis curvula TaxID=38414 RepID=A0A5J9VP37_9POAL|nr:hypothetical protein EJB05_18780 [Eragrostis curvula]